MVGDGAGRMAGRVDGGEARAAAARVAARVAERYAQAPSYRELLAASAAAAAEAARAATLAAEQAVVAQQAQEAAERQQEAEREAACGWAEGGAGGVAGPAEETERCAVYRAEATVEHPQPLPVRGPVPPRRAGMTEPAGRGMVDAMAEAVVPAAMGLPAKLIQFPRELVAARRGRTGIAEEEKPALRIFEVEDTGEAAGPAVFGEPGEVEGYGEGARASKGTGVSEPVWSRAVPGAVLGERGGGAREDGRAAREPDWSPGEAASAWQTIRLGEHPVSGAEEVRGEEVRGTGSGIGSGIGSAVAGSPGAGSAMAGSGGVSLHVASVGDRTMAALVDGSLVGGAFLLFVLIFAMCTAHPPMGRAGLAGGALVFGCMFVFYEWLFLSYGTGTPGMRYAGVAVCTFDDENPTRRMMRQRVLASVLSAVPLGLGFLWALVDEERLGWHDRMTRSYQRSYR